MNQARLNPPDGIQDRHHETKESLARHASWLSIAVLSSLMIAALTGVLGGAPRPVSTSQSAAARLDVRMPRTIRNGEFFETEIIVTPRRDIDELVVAVTPGLWRNVTLNTFIPAASKESFENGAFRFEFGPVAANKPFVIKLDSQINPSLMGGTAGAITVADGRTTLTSQAIEMQVLP